MVKVELPDTAETPKEVKETPATKAADSKFLQPKDVSDVVLYLLTTPHNVNVSQLAQFQPNKIAHFFQITDLTVKPTGHWGKRFYRQIPVKCIQTFNFFRKLNEAIKTNMH